MNKWILCFSLGMIAPLHCLADDNMCRGILPYDGAKVTEIRLGEVNDRAARAYLFKDVSGCPQAGATCQTKRYLVSGNSVAIYPDKISSYTCITFIPSKGEQISSWVKDSDVSVVAPPTTQPDWLGVWIGDGATIKIAPGKSAGLLSIHGEAEWNAGAHVGEIDGEVAPQDATVSFAMGESKTLTVAESDPSDCRVWMKRVGPWLAVNDNAGCGGMNVSFAGFYRLRSSRMGR